MPVIFSPPLLRTLAAALKDKSSYLHKSAAKSMDRLVSWAQKSGEPGAAGGQAADVRLAIVLALACYTRTGFDGVTQTKAVAKLQATLDSAALRQYVAQLKDAFARGSLQAEGGTCARCLRVLALSVYGAILSFLDLT